jgi:glycosyltransferase involved in cell wall biosynthesis
LDIDESPRLMKKKLAIVTTHPIQYNAPWIKLLAESGNVHVKVFYTLSQSENGKLYDKGFDKNFSWDIPLLDGYEYEFITNVSSKPGTHHFRGIINPGLIQSISCYEPDSILVIGWAFQSHLSVIRYFSGKKHLMFRGDSTLLNEKAGFSLKKTFRRNFLKWVYNYVNTALYVGENNKEYFLKHGLKEHQLVFAPHAIDNKRFEENSTSHYETAMLRRKELGIPEHHLVVLYAGKIEPVKNVSFIIRLAKTLDHAGISFLIVGNGPMEDQIKQEAVYCNNVYFMNFQNQSVMPVVYRMGQVFLLSSFSETWGLALNEAMACGRPVMASYKCGAAADLVNEKTGLVFNADDTTDVANFLLKLSEHPQLLKESSRAAIAHIQFYNFKRITSAIEIAMRE